MKADRTSEEGMERLFLTEMLRSRKESRETGPSPSVGKKPWEIKVIERMPAGLRMPESEWTKWRQVMLHRIRRDWTEYTLPKRFSRMTEGEMADYPIWRLLSELVDGGFLRRSIGEDGKCYLFSAVPTDELH